MVTGCHPAVRSADQPRGRPGERILGCPCCGEARPLPLRPLFVVTGVLAERLRARPAWLGVRREVE